MEDDSPTIMPMLDIYGLHVRHPGMAREITENLAVNAAVCMERHGPSPRAWAVRLDDDASTEYRVNWQSPTARQIRACANRDDATRDGAYALALAAADVHLGYVALRRAEGRTGIDFYMLPAGTDIPTSPEYDIDREDLIGFEVSGIDDDADSALRSRLQRKIDQVRAGKLPIPAIVAVVGFRTARVAFRTVEG